MDERPRSVTTLTTTSVVRAAAIIRRGGTVAFPTETVYGLGADAFNPVAVERIFAAKNRPADNPLIVHLARAEDVGLVAESIPSDAARLVETFFPGPITVILHRARRIPDVVTAGLDTVAVRVPDLPMTHAFLQACATPVAAPSANLSGRPSPTTWHAVLEDLDGRIDCVLEGPRARHGVESTVVDCTADPPVVLRTGAISVERLQAVVPAIQIPDQDSPLLSRSPGTRHRHYAPRATVVIVESPAELPEDASGIAFIGRDAPPGNRQRLKRQLLVASDDAYAHALYDFLRECDAANDHTVYCQAVPETGLGRAIMDRLRRAAAGSTDGGTV